MTYARKRFGKSQWGPGIPQQTHVNRLGAILLRYVCHGVAKFSKKKSILAALWPSFMQDKLAVTGALFPTPPPTSQSGNDCMQRLLALARECTPRGQYATIVSSRPNLLRPPIKCNLPNSTLTSDLVQQMTNHKRSFHAPTLVPGRSNEGRTCLSTVGNVVP